MDLHIAVIVGSTRQGRFSDRPAQWIFEEAQKLDGVTAELLDLRDYPMPFYDEMVSPSTGGGNYENPAVQAWKAKIEAADAFIIVTPEYNHSMPAVLKNAMDYVYAGWNNKPVGFVSYGGAGGTRAVQQLRQVAVELQMAPIRNGLHIYGSKFFPILMGQAPWAPTEDPSLMDGAEKLLTQLIWWGNALKAAR